MTRCLICQSTIEKGDLCDAHLIAKKNLESNYNNWKKAFSGLTWEAYLSKLVSESDIPIGDWAKEVAEYLLKNKK